MNSITLDSSFRVKVGQTILNLFIVDTRVIVCSESSTVRSDVDLCIQDSPKLFKWSVAAAFQYAFVETFTAKLRFFTGHVIAVVCLTR